MKSKNTFRVIDNKRAHPRDLARQAVAEHRKVHAAPMINQHDTPGKPVLDIDSVLRRVEAAQEEHLGKQ